MDCDNKLRLTKEGTVNLSLFLLCSGMEVPMEKERRT